jgi:hypothetical protein
LASPKWSKHLNTATSSLKCGDMSGSTSTNKKSKDKFFVANEVSESTLNQLKLDHKIYNQQKKFQASSFLF